ncbi:MAG TPA: alginate lyase family protein [Polyangiaceae bacterium]
MRSPLVRALFVSCSWLIPLACGGAGSGSGDPLRGGSAGTAAASGGSAGSAAGSNAVGASGAGADAGGADAVAGASAGASTSTAGGGSVGMGGSGGGSGGAPLGFVHPGILVNQGMLDFVKAKIAAGTAPWKNALSKVSSDSMGSLSYTATPHATVECGPTSNPDIGCTDEKNDVIAAYTHALIWYHTGDMKHAAKAIEIMNAWSAVLKKHTLDNEQLQASWAAEIFPRAAEIIRYSNAGWAQADIEQFKIMLKTAYLPEVANGSTRTGNWDTSAIDAAMNIAIFLDDTTEFAKAVALWRARTPAYIYLSTDGALPVQPPRQGALSATALKSYWYNPKQFVDGLTQESCRDVPGSGTAGFGHAQYGVAGIINAAETARIQGVDLFASEQKRLTAMLELHSKYLNGASIADLCNTAIAGVEADPTWEIGYNAYANVLGQALPTTQTLIKSIRPTGATHHMAWETLTHGDIGNAGL